MPCELVLLRIQISQTSQDVQLYKPEANEGKASVHTVLDRRDEDDAIYDKKQASTEPYLGSLPVHTRGSAASLSGFVSYPFGC